MKFQLLAPCLCLLSICFSTPSEDFLLNKAYLEPDIASKNITILLSEIHSGSTWCRYLIEYGTKKPTMQIFDHLQGNLPLGLVYEDLGTNLDQPKIWKCHNEVYINRVFQALCREPSPNDKLIFILRDYRECFTRLYRTKEEITKLLDSRRYNYIDILQRYDDWNDENKLLILYRDLVVNPEKALRQLMTFLGDFTEIPPDFTRNLEFHKDRAKQVFNSNFGISQSLNGQTPEESLVFHQNEFPPSFWMEVDFQLAERHPDLWQKYLKPLFRKDFPL